MSIVVGIDPGPKESAVVAWDGNRVVSSDDWENSRVCHHPDCPCRKQKAEAE